LWSLLLLNLSDNILKHAQNNTVVSSQKEMDRVGFEPTTSANFLDSALYLSKQSSLWKEKK
jgi:hypothetical protein